MNVNRMNEKKEIEKKSFVYSSGTGAIREQRKCRSAEFSVQKRNVMLLEAIKKIYFSARTSAPSEFPSDSSWSLVEDSGQQVQSVVQHLDFYFYIFINLLSLVEDSLTRRSLSCMLNEYSFHEFK